MKVTQDTETGKLVIDGEGTIVKCTKSIPADPIEKITNFHFDFSEVKTPHPVPLQASESPVSG